MLKSLYIEQMNPEIKIYNSLSRAKESLPEAKKLRLFVCGPTVYDDTHIGHARTYIFFDFFVKYLRGLGRKIEYVQNITNIDDKIINRAKQEKKEPLEFADEFTKRYLDDMKLLGIDSVNKYAPATKFIKQIVKQVKTLAEKGYAYKISNDGWYYDVAKFKDYGKLSGRSAEQAEDAVSRIDESVGKKNKADFCLWKFSPPAGGPGEPTWKTELGDGRPGWHIEDTAISENYFGPQYEIHGGGMDLKFPHHEAEIAQQEAASGKSPFVNIWMHTGMVTVNGQKMSKSLGNFITIKDFLKKYPPEVLRWIVFSHHYRSSIDYSEEIAEQAKTNLETIRLFLGKIEFLFKTKNVSLKVTDADFVIQSALAEDINTPIAIADIFQAISDIQPVIWNWKETETVRRETYVNIKSLLKLFGISLEIPKIPREISKLAAEREKFRSNKQFAQSDALRKKLDELGYLVEDTPAGPFVWPKN